MNVKASVVCKIAKRGFGSYVFFIVFQFPAGIGTCILATVSKLHLGPTQPSIHWVRAIIPRG